MQLIGILLRREMGKFKNLDKMVDKEYIEKEVRERVNFKLNDINDVINNRLRWTQLLIGDSPHMRMEKMMRKKILKEVKEIFDKEKNMPVPYNEMYLERKSKQKDIAVDNIVGRYEEMTRGTNAGRNRFEFTKLVVRNIENSQR